VLFIYKRHIFIAFLPCIRASWNTKRSENSTFPSLGSFQPVAAAILRLATLHQLPSIPLLRRVCSKRLPSWRQLNILPRTAAVSTIAAQTHILNSLTPRHFSDTLIPCSNRHPSLIPCLCSTLRLFRLSAFFQYPASCLCSTLRRFRLSAPVVSSAKALSAADAKALPSQYSSHASHSFT